MKLQKLVAGGVGKKSQQEKQVSSTKAILDKEEIC